MNTHTEIESKIAWWLISEAVQELEGFISQEDLDASVVATLALALELASQRKLKPIYEIYESI